MEGSVVRSVWVGAGGWGSVSVTTLLSEQRIFREAVSAPRGLFPKLLMKTKQALEEGRGTWGSHSSPKPRACFWGPDAGLRRGGAQEPGTPSPPAWHSEGAALLPIFLKAQAPLLTTVHAAAPKGWGPRLWGLMEGTRLSETGRKGTQLFAVSNSGSALSFALMTSKSLLFLLS